MMVVGMFGISAVGVNVITVVSGCSGSLKVNVVTSTSCGGASEPGFSSTGNSTVVVIGAVPVGVITVIEEIVQCVKVTVSGSLTGPVGVMTIGTEVVDGDDGGNETVVVIGFESDGVHVTTVVNVTIDGCVNVTISGTPDSPVGVMIVTISGGTSCVGSVNGNVITVVSISSLGGNVNVVTIGVSVSASTVGSVIVVTIDPENVKVVDSTPPSVSGKVTTVVSGTVGSGFVGVKVTTVDDGVSSSSDGVIVTTVVPSSLD